GGLAEAKQMRCLCLGTPYGCATQRPCSPRSHYVSGAATAQRGRAVAALITGGHSRWPPTESAVVSMNLRELARDTLRILDAGSYRAPHGETVDLASGMRAAISGTRLCEP